jgi:hypothetical protein
MTNKTCSLCGIVFETEAEICATCFALITVPGELPTPAFESTAAQTYDPEPAFQENFDQSFQPIEVNSFQSNYPPPANFESNYQPHEAFQSNYPTPANFESNYQSNDHFESNYQPHQTFGAPVQPTGFESNYQPTDGFQSNSQPHASFGSNPQPAEEFPPAGNAAPRYSPPPPRDQPSARIVETAYKPSVWNWFTELPGFAKVGGIVLIFAVCFAIVLKSFMTLDVSVVGTETLEEQKPWYWSVFRSNPTADEILDKYETVTYAKNKPVMKQSIVISGRGQFLRLPAGGFDIAGLRKDPEAAFQSPEDKKPGAKPKAPHIANNPRLPDFDVTFEISLKGPDKMLAQLLMKPKDGFTQSFVTYRTIGFNGDRAWGFSQVVVNGNSNILDDVNRTNKFFFNHTSDGISLAIQRSMYSWVELKSVEAVHRRRAYNVEVTDMAGEKFNIFFDIETGLATRVTNQGAEFEIVDYSNFDGVLCPSKMLYKLSNDWIFLVADKFQADAPFNDSIFERASYK